MTPSPHSDRPARPEPLERHSPLATFLTDFGLQDTYVGVVKGVMLSIAPHLAIVDLTHQVPPQDVWEGAFQLMTAVGYFPPGTVHLAVVDPGVGTERRAVAAELAGHRLVGPDNGLLSLALRRLAREQQAELREVDSHLAVRPPLAAVDLTEPRVWRHPVSHTFHARDVFGPVAAHLALGVPLDQLGPPLERLVSLPFPAPERPSDRLLVGRVVHVDRFGNLVTNLPAEMLWPDVRVRVGRTTIVGIRPTYGHGQAPVALIGSAGYLELAVPGGSAAEQLGVGRGEVVELEVE